MVDVEDRLSDQELCSGLDFPHRKFHLVLNRVAKIDYRTDAKISRRFKLASLEVLAFVHIRD